MSAKNLVALIKKRIVTSKGVVFHFAKEVEIITLEDLEFALNRFMEEGKISFMRSKMQNV